MISGEKTKDEQSYINIVKGHPWVAVPFKSEFENKVKKLVPYLPDEFLTIGVLNGTTGTLIDPNFYGNHDDFHSDSCFEHAKKRKKGKVVYDIWYKHTAVYR